MNKPRVIAICLSIFALLSGVASGRGWRGIVPLRSTRADVERILGQPERSGPISVYRTRDGLVEVRYAESPCKGRILGWNVPSETVLEFHFAPSKRESITIDLSRYVMAVGHVARPRYINLQDGIAYDLLPTREVYSVSYFPAKSQNGLRCAGFPPYDAGLTQYRPFDSFSDSPTIDKEARLDNFAVTLQNDPSASGYIIVYAGRKALVGEARTRGEQARDYLVRERRINKRRLIVVDGGHREELETELFIVPISLPAPTPTPTIASTEAKIIKAKKERTDRHKSRSRYGRNLSETTTMRLVSAQKQRP
jgi:hypothetical protein